MFYVRLLLFLLINFAGLSLGGLFTSEGVSSDWYANLNKAPWTPQGWVFGVAWTTIMICLAIFMSKAWNLIGRKPLAFLFGLQWLLNFVWNPIFFGFHEMGCGLLVIIGLTVIVVLLFLRYPNNTFKWLLLPYILWLGIATSLNLYSWIFN